jgi:hypothetical protein
LINCAGIVAESNKLLHEIVEHNKQQMELQAKKDEQSEKNDIQLKKQLSGTTSLQIMSSGSIIASFRALVFIVNVDG